MPGSDVRRCLSFPGSNPLPSANANRLNALARVLDVAISYVVHTASTRSGEMNGTPGLWVVSIVNVEDPAQQWILPIPAKSEEQARVTGAAIIAESRGIVTKAEDCVRFSDWLHQTGLGTGLLENIVSGEMYRLYILRGVVPMPMPEGVM